MAMIGGRLGPVLDKGGAVDPLAAPISKSVAVTAKIGDVVEDARGISKPVKQIIINEDQSVTYKTDDGHKLTFVSETKHEATFQCDYCKRLVAFALPGSGEPLAHGSAGAWEPHPEFAKWMEPCSTS